MTWPRRAWPVVGACVVAGCGSTVTAPTSPSAPTSGAGQTACSSSVVTGDPNVSSTPRCVRFGGYEWVVKSSAQFGPGPNVWSDQPSSVWVDAQGLHLTIQQVGGIWTASEVILNRSLGHGTYSFRTNVRPAQLDRNVVFGLFTYNYADPAFAHREIDMEFSPSLGATPGASGHFTVQPYQVRGNTHDFVSDGSPAQMFDWRPDRVTFQSGGEEWTYFGQGAPSAGGENVRINLWLFGGQPPSNGQPVELVITSFDWRP